MKSTLKHYYHRIDNKVVNTLTYMGRTEKRPIAKHPTIDIYTTNNFNELLNIARRYDVDQFFELEERIQKHDIKLAHRIMLSSYRRVRDIGLKSAKALYRLRQGR